MAKHEVSLADGPWARAAVCSNVGRRGTNEDAYVLLCNGLNEGNGSQKVKEKKTKSAPAPTGGGLFDDLPDTVAGPSLPAVEKKETDVECLVAVLDGHGGSAAAQVCAKLMGSELHEQLEAAGRDSAEARKTAMQGLCLALDRHLRIKLGPKLCDMCGTTCVLGYAWQLPDTPNRFGVLLANLGDSRALVLSLRGGGGLKLVGQTTDHKPELPSEVKRIEAAGGQVKAHSLDQDLKKPRVDGQLGTARALGDFSYKADAALLPEQQKVSNQPDVFEFECRAGDVVVLACDGIFDVLSSDDVVATVIRELKKKDDLAAAAAAIVDAALKNPENEDNCTCIVLKIKL